MTRPSAYTRLDRETLRLLCAPENEEVRDAWLHMNAVLSGAVAMFSVTYPRPLYYYEERVPGDIAEGLAKLSGTPFYARMVRNVEAAGAIRRMWEESGHTDELHQAADAYLDDSLDDYTAVTMYPEVPEPARTADAPERDEPRRRIAGG